jgi:hypothetical protein
VLDEAILWRAWPGSPPSAASAWSIVASPLKTRRCASR